MLHDVFHVGLCPLGESGNDGDERAACVGKGIFDTRGHFLVVVSVDECVGFERSEGVGQYAGRNVGNLATEFVESYRLVLADDEYDKEGPFVTETGYHVAHGAYLDDGVELLLLSHFQ